MSDTGFNAIKICSLIFACTVVTPAGAADSGNEQWNAATQLFKSADYSHALPALISLESSYPRNEKIHYMMGVCYKNLGRAAQAERELKWVATYTPDATLKQSALTALSEIKADLEKQKAAAPPPKVADPAKPATPLFSIPPGKGLVRDSVSETIRAADAKGWKPCDNYKCLNYSKSGWQHMSVPGHTDSEIWMQFPGIAFSQNHIGEIIETNGPTRDVGPCMKCIGTGWIKKK